MLKIRALLVDDEYFNRELLKMMISRVSGAFEIVGEANNLREGIRMMTELAPHVIFLDVKMPDGSGFELLRQAPEFNCHVVFITGFDEFAQRAFEQRAFDYILKPIDQDKLRVTIERLEAVCGKE